MTSDQKRKAIQHVVLRGNPFSTCSQLVIREKGYRRGPNRGIWDGAARQASLRIMESAGRKISAAVATIAGILLGLALALPICGVLLGYSFLVLEPDPWRGVLPLLVEQSLRNYVGWMLAGVSVFLCPYLLLGLPTHLGPFFNHTAGGYFARRRMHRELLRENENNDPALLKPQAVSYRPTREENHCPGLIEYHLYKVAAILGALTGGIAGGSFLLIYLKCAIYIFRHDVGVFVFIVLVTWGFSLFLGYWALIGFFRSFYYGNLAIVHFLEQLYDNEPFGSALRQAVGSFFEKLLGPPE